MSEVLKFFNEHPITGDVLHDALSKMPGLEARLQEIRRDALACCGCEIGKGSKIELCVVDKGNFTKLSEEQASIISKLEALDKLVADLDQIFADAAAKGIMIDRKTPKGILDVEVTWRRDHRQEDPAPWNPATRDKGLANPDLVSILERATAAMHAAGIAF